MKKLLLSMALLLSGANMLGIVAIPMRGVDTPQGIRPDGLPYGHPISYQPNSATSKSSSSMFGPLQSQYNELPKKRTDDPYPYEITPDEDPTTWGSISGVNR